VPGRRPPVGMMEYLVEVSIAGPMRSVSYSLRGLFCGWLFGFAVIFGLAIDFGATIAGHSQPAPALPAAAPAPSATAEAPAFTAAAHAAPVAVPVPPHPAEITPGELPRDLTPVGMFMSADIIVKAVMLGLVFASALTWMIWLAKTFELLAVRRGLRRAAEIISAAASLDDIAKRASAASAHVALLVGAAQAELSWSSDHRDVGGIKERIAARFGRIESGVGRSMTRATGVIATIGATAPFVGLFGTVWGIMNSFVGISKLHTTNLAVVAPGIAEALLATACGLAAAIPAVVIYNGFSRSIAHYRGLFADASVEVLTLVGRDLARPAYGADDRRPLAAVPGGGAR
jgi:biopolymer transport protein ExbB